MDLCSHKHDFGISAEWMLFATSYYKSPVLDYKAILDLCENEMMSIKFFRICKESMISVGNLEIDK